MQGPGTTEPDPRSSGINLADGRPEAEGEASNLQLLRRVILGLIQAISDGAELIGATMCEEISRARLEIEHRLTVILLMSAGIVLFSAGVLLLLQELIGRWYLTLLIVGSVHVTVGLWLSHRWKRMDSSK
jgi:hypothetical protein